MSTAARLGRLFWPYTLTVQFEWDPEKALRNHSKHRVSFEEATTVFGDALAATVPDPIHSKLEFRFVTMGMSIQNRLLVLGHSDAGESVRIISARVATAHESKRYESRP